MRKYVLRLRPPNPHVPPATHGPSGENWRSQPATNRQLKVLRFFNLLPSTFVAKWTASKIITKVFDDSRNVDLWENYKRVTGDYGQQSPFLVEFDPRKAAFTPAAETQRRRIVPRKHYRKLTDEERRARATGADIMHEPPQSNRLPPDEPRFAADGAILIIVGVLMAAGILAAFLALFR